MPLESWYPISAIRVSTRLYHDRLTSKEIIYAAATGDKN